MQTRSQSVGVHYIYRSHTHTDNVSTIKQTFWLCNWLITAAAAATQWDCWIGFIITIIIIGIIYFLSATAIYYL